MPEFGNRPPTGHTIAQQLNRMNLPTIGVLLPDSPKQVIIVSATHSPASATAKCLIASKIAHRFMKSTLYLDGHVGEGTLQQVAFATALAAGVTLASVSKLVKSQGPRIYGPLWKHKKVYGLESSLDPKVLKTAQLLQGLISNIRNEAHGKVNLSSLSFMELYQQCKNETIGHLPDFPLLTGRSLSELKAAITGFYAEKLLFSRNATWAGLISETMESTPAIVLAGVEHVFMNNGFSSEDTHNYTISQSLSAHGIGSIAIDPRAVDKNFWELDGAAIGVVPRISP